MIEDIIIDRIEEAAAKIDAAASAVQAEMMNRIDAILRSLKYNADGTIAQTAENSKAVTRLYNELRKLLTRGAYAAAVEAYTGELGDIAALWDKFFTDLIGNAFNPDRKLFERLWTEAAQATTESLNGLGVQQDIGKGAQAVLRANINSRASAKETEKALRLFIEGDKERLGHLLSYVKQISRDGASQFSRNYTQAVGSVLGIEWYFYSGGTVRESRDFCKARQGGYYHMREIKDWAGLSWQGKIPGTNSATIFSYLGGYNCMHILRPVSTESVPKDALNRIK